MERKPGAFQRFAAFGFCYRSPMYWKIGGIEGYPLSGRTAYGLELKKL